MSAEKGGNPRTGGEWLGRVRSVYGKLQEFREAFRTSDETERSMVAPLVPGQEVRYVGLGELRLPELHKAGSQFADEMGRELAESFDPRVLFGLLNIVNPVMWVEAVIAPVRYAAGLLMLPANAAALATGTGQSGTAVSSSPAGGPARDGAVPEERPPVPLTPEQETFRAVFRLSRYRPLADQLAEIAYKWRYVFSGDLASLAGSMLLFLARYTGVRLAVTESHLHLVRMGPPPPPDKPDRRKPRLLWSVPLHRIARIESDHGGLRRMLYPYTITFDDGSWLRLSYIALRDDQMRFLAAIRQVPGSRPAVGKSGR